MPLVNQIEQLAVLVLHEFVCFDKPVVAIEVDLVFKRLTYLLVYFGLFAGDSTQSADSIWTRTIGASLESSSSCDEDPSSALEACKLASKISQSVAVCLACCLSIDSSFGSTIASATAVASNFAIMQYRGAILA